MKTHISRGLFEMMPISTGFFSKLGSHQTMLMDKTRCDGYKTAIQNVVKPGDIVVDVGTGTGILAFLAAKAGAKKVYAIESSGMTASMAERLISINKLEDQIILIRGEAPDINIPDRVDVIVSETVGFWGIDENIIDTIYKIKRNFGHENTLCIPNTIQLFLVPISKRGFYKRIDFWEKPIYGIDYLPLRTFACNNVYVRVVVSEKEFLSDPALVSELRVGTIEGPTMNFTAQFHAMRNGTFHGFAGWFRMKLSENVWIETDPRLPILHWKQCVFPAEKPVKVKKGDHIICNIQVDIISNVIHFDWTTSLTFVNQRPPINFIQSTKNFLELR